MAEESTTQPANSERQVASPFATGGGGTVFENKTQAGLFAVLLVRGHLPLFENVSLEELHLQTERLGYKTDDALALGFDSSGKRRKQLWSVKHEVKFTASDQVFQEVIGDAWADFTNSTLFDQSIDAIVLATGGVAAKAKHLLTMLGFARAATSGDNFKARIEHGGLISNEARAYLTICQKHTDTAAGRTVTPHELWSFLRCFHIVSYDFDLDASQSEAQFKTLLALALRPESGKTGADLWNSVFAWVSKMNPRAGSFTRGSLPLESMNSIPGSGRGGIVPPFQGLDGFGGIVPGAVRFALHPRLSHCGLTGFPVAKWRVQNPCVSG